MIRILLGLSLVAALGACGADGRPTPPPRKEPAQTAPGNGPNISISGTAGVGVVGGSSSGNIRVSG